MAKKKTSGAKIAVEGALLGIALGVAAGMYLASNSTKELKGRLAEKYAEFSKFMAPKLKKLKKVSQSEYEMMVDKAMVGFGKAAKMTKSEALALAKTAKKHFREISKLANK